MIVLEGSIIGEKILIRRLIYRFLPTKLATKQKFLEGAIGEKDITDWQRCQGRWTTPVVPRGKCPL